MHLYYWKPPLSWYFRCTYRHFCRLSPQFLYIGYEHGMWSTFTLQKTCICYLVSFGCRNLALYWESLLHLGINKGAFLACWASIWRVGMTIFLSISMYICPYIFCCIHMSISTFICPALCSSVCQYNCTSYISIPTSLICFTIHPYTPIIASGNPDTCMNLKSGVQQWFVRLDIFILGCMSRHAKSLYLLSRGYHLSLCFTGIPIFSHRKLFIVNVFFIVCSHFCLKWLWPLLHLCQLCALRHPLLWLLLWLPPIQAKQHQIYMIASATTVDAEGHNEEFCSIPQQQQPHSQMPSRANANFSWVLLRCIFSFRVEPSTSSYDICWCLLWCLFSVIRYLCGCHVHCTLWSTPLAGICDSLLWSVAYTRSALSWCSFYCLD